MDRKTSAARKARALTLRSEGTSYSSIVAETGLAKSTLSLLFGKEIPQNADLVRENTLTRKRDVGALLAGKTRYLLETRSQRLKEWSTLLSEYQNQGFIHYMAGLYDGEGAKYDPTVFQVSNSTERLVLATIRFLNEVLKLPHTRIRVVLHLHSKMDRERCLAFWLQKGIVPTKVIQCDSRTPKKPLSERQLGNYFGTVQVSVSKPLGLREALRHYSEFGGS